MTQTFRAEYWVGAGNRGEETIKADTPEEAVERAEERIPGAYRIDVYAMTRVGKIDRKFQDARLTGGAA